MKEEFAGEDIRFALEQSNNGGVELIDGSREEKLAARWVEKGFIRPLLW